MWNQAKAQILIIVASFAVLVIISASGLTFPGPAAWLGDWVRLLGTVIAIVAGLKLAWTASRYLQIMIDRK